MRTASSYEKSRSAGICGKIFHKYDLIFTYSFFFSPEFQHTLGHPLSMSNYRRLFSLTINMLPMSSWRLWTEGVAAYPRGRSGVKEKEEKVGTMAAGMRVTTTPLKMVVRLGGTRRGRSEEGRRMGQMKMGMGGKQLMPVIERGGRKGIQRGKRGEMEMADDSAAMNNCATS